MRNLKRALSLLLSSTLVLGMLVMGSSAASYKDVDASNDHQEAIEVLKAVGVMSGIDNEGNFDPDGSVTRNQMAVIMAHLLNLDYDYYRGTNPFTDVPEWAAPYVAACAAEGVIAGIGNGQFGGEMKVTAAQASLMIMKALGYFQNAEDFGSDWQVATIRQASYINLFANINSNAESALTRAQVAQLVLNGLKAKMVDFTGDKGVQIGDVTVGYKAEYTPKTSAAAKYNTIDVGTTNIAENDQYYIQLGEELYNGDLRLDNSTDDYGRPARAWSFEGKDIGTYAKKELMVASYTTGVTGKELYNELSETAIRNNELYNYVDGHEGSIVKENLVRSNNNNLADTGRGVLTEVYLDSDAKEITIASINTYLAQATSDYNEKSETVTLQVYYGNNQQTTKRVDAEDVPAIVGLKKDAFVLVNWASDTNSAASKDIMTVSDVEVLSNVEVTRFSKNNDDDQAHNGVTADRVTQITTGGTKYDNNRNAWFDNQTLGDYDGNLLTKKTYNVYLDQYGYFIGAELYSGEDQYVFVAAYDTNGSATGIRNADALAIFTDGTMKDIKVNAKDTNDNIDRVRTLGNPSYNATVAGDSAYARWNGQNQVNRWFTYTEDNGVYTLTPVDNYVVDINNTGSDVTIRTDSLALANNGAGDVATGRAFGNEDSIYITAENNTVGSAGAVIDEVTGLYTGVQSARLTYVNGDWVSAVYDDDNYVIAAVVLGEAEGAVDNYAYILTGAYAEERDGDGNYYWDFDVVMGGEIKTMTVKTKYTNTVTRLVPGTVQELVLDAEGYVTKINSLPNTTTGTAYSKGVNEVYDNSELNAHLAVTDFDVYNVAGNGATLSLVGRSLHIDPTWDHNGLFFSADAKAVVSQSVNGSRDEVEYASVKEAFSTLADSDANSANGLNFNGDIVAVLDANGVAQWVFFYDRTNIGTGNDPDYGTGSGLGDVRGMNGVITIPGNLGSAGNALVRAEVLAQKDGVYQADGAKPADAATGQYENLLYFKVTNKEAGSAYTLNIRNSAGQLVYTETYAGNYPAGAVMCYVNIAPATDSVTNSGSGSMVNTDLTAGSYTYTFSCGTNSVSGTFSVK